MAIRNEGTLQKTYYAGATVNASRIVKLDSRGADTWFGAVFVMLTGLGLFELARRQYVHEWGEIQAEIEKEIKRRETAV